MKTRPLFTHRHPIGTHSAFCTGAVSPKKEMWQLLSCKICGTFCSKALWCTHPMDKTQICLESFSLLRIHFTWKCFLWIHRNGPAGLLNQIKFMFKYVWEEEQLPTIVDPEKKWTQNIFYLVNIPHVIHHPCQRFVQSKKSYLWHEISLTQI